VFTYFVHYAEACFNSPPPNLVLAVNMGLRACDPRFRAAVLNWGMDNLGEERAPDHPWRKPFAEALFNADPAKYGWPEIDEDIIVEGLLHGTPAPRRKLPAMAGKTRR